ncbi:MAG: hypothetical protein CMC08_10155 [Flavobacteriaceae bacterium]|nr:hypothetical protein [Flavobacteriaceae bacterium]
MRVSHLYRIIRILLIGSTTLLLSCKQNKPVVTGTVTAGWEHLELKLDSVFTAYVGSNEPGVAVMVAYNGKTLFSKGYGLRDLETKQPLTPTSNMELASVSKQFTALAILSLVEQGKLSLSDTLFNILPYDTFRNVTIQQLLNHTSGLDDAEEYFYTHWDASKIANNNDVLEWYVEKNKSVKTAHQNFRYNNGTYELIPLVVEKVSGERYDKFLQKHIFEKAGMEHSVAFDLNHPVSIRERAHYYHQDSSGVWNKMDGHPLTGLFGAGGIYTSLSDYFQYDQALRDSSLLSKEMHRLIFKPTSIETTNGKEQQYAMGWVVNDSMAEHGGGWFGVNTHVRRYLDRPLTIVLFANRDDFFERELISVTDSIVRSAIEKTPFE